MTNNKEQTRNIVRWWVTVFFSAVVFALTLFLPARDWTWGWGWAMVGVLGGWQLLMGFVLTPLRPELLAERATRSPKTLRWDLILTSLIFSIEFIRNIVAGFDYRFGWSAEMSPTIHILAIVIGLSGSLLTVWAMLNNPFFATTVYIQDEKDHHVVSGGPYRIIRHPGYLSGIVYHLAAPFVLGSTWALIPAIMLGLIFVFRTAMEDRTLVAELDGYEDFTRQTKHRLIPGIW